MSGPVKRATRVANALQEELAKAIQGMSDPRLFGVVVSRVDVTDDLQSGKVHIRLATTRAEEGARKAALKALGAAAHRLRDHVAHALRLRYVPTLRFFYDDSLDAVTRVDELLREIAADAESKPRG